jgi:inhibitor of KinA
MAPYTIFQLGDQAVTLSLGNAITPAHHSKIISIRNWLRQHTFPGLLDIIVAYSTLTVIYDLYEIKRNINPSSVFDFVQQHLNTAYNSAGDLNVIKPNLKRIPVCYEGPFSPDMDLVASLKQISTEEIIKLHTSKIYQVYMIGFLPGFPYMAEIDQRLIVPRKDKPRASVEAGSVGLAGIQTGIYPVVSPGGWQIIGRTPVILFNKNDNPPVKLEPGDAIQFYAITKKEFEQFEPSLQ